MKYGAYILVNGQFYTFSEYKIQLQQAECLLFTERIKSIRTSFPFFKETIQLIKFKLLLLNQTFTELTDNEGSELKRQIERTLTKNKHFLGAILHINFWLSDQNSIQYSIHSTKTEHSGYEMNNKGLYISIARQIRKSVTPLSNISLGSDIYWKIAMFHLEDKSNEIVLINTRGLILESPNSNIYIIKEGVIKGASAKHGAYIDISKPLMLSIFANLKLNYNESDGITEQDLNEADEVLLVNALVGIRWVIGYEGKRYFNQVIRKINNTFTSTFIP